MAEDINDQVAGDPTAPITDATPKAEPTESAEALLAALKDLGVDTPEKIHNIADASQQTGKAFNEVGELRKQLAQQTELIKSFQNQPKPSDPYADDQAVDLQGLIRNELKSFWTEQTEAQNQAASAFHAEMGAIQGNSRYPAVKEIFEQHMATPATQLKLRQGQTTLKDEFNNVCLTFQDSLLQRAYKTVSATQPQATMPPHIEGDTKSVPLPTQLDEKKSKINQVVKGRKEGDISSDDALKSIIEQTLGKDDPIWQT